MDFARVESMEHARRLPDDKVHSEAVMLAAFTGARNPLQRYRERKHSPILLRLRQPSRLTAQTSLTSMIE